MMNRLNPVLAAATLVLAGLAVHYAGAARAQRAQNAQALVAATHPAGDPVGSAGQLDSATAITQVAAPSSNGGKPARDTRFDPETLALARFRLEELRDPRSRAQRMKELVDLYFGGMATVAPYIGLSRDKLQGYAETRAELTLRSLVRQLSCQIDPVCDIAALQSARQAGAKQDEALALGPEMAARLKAFQAAFYERNLVRALQQALPAANALTFTQAERLALALSEETEKFDAEAERYGKTTHGYIGLNAVEVRSATNPGAPDEFSQKRESASRHQQMLYVKAASLLTAAQLREFKAMQEATIERYLEQLREDEIAADARMAARK